MEELADLLRQAGANLVVGVRSISRSRTNPQFNADIPPDALAAFQISYRHIQKLGGLLGRREDQPPSHNSFWKYLSFRNYAGHMNTATPYSREGMTELRKLGRVHVCALRPSESWL